MAKNNVAWGIDVGANAIKAVKLARSGGEVVVEDFAVMPFKQVLTTPDLDVDQTIQVQLEAFMLKHAVDKTPVVASVPGNMAFARFAKLPPVEPKKIPDIVKFEAQQQIPFPIEQVEWDYQVFQQDDSPDVEVGIFAITKERVMQHLANYRIVEMKVDQLTLSPLAVYNTFNYESPDGEGAIYMDIGTVSTDVIIVEDGGIWLRTLPIGGNNFTEALVKQFKISFPKAEKLKREAATSKYAKQIFQAMRAVFADLVQEVQRSLGFYQSLNRDSNLTKLVGVGSTFRLPGLQKFLKQQLQIDVVRPDSFDRMSVADGKRESEFSNHALNMATACGLALQGLGLDKVSANILPRHVLASRMWRAKQPWIAASAACFVAAAGLTATKHFIDKGIIDQQLADISSAVRPIVNEADKQQAAWAEIQQNSDPRQFIKNVRRSLDYRNVWPLLLEDISAATMAIAPQPELVDDDPTNDTDIERRQRRRIYIQNITTQYDPKLPGAASNNGRGASNIDLQTLASKIYTAEEFFTEESGPQFIVTLTGTTPLSNADSQLNARVIQWLRDNAEREDLPYTFKFIDGQPPLKRLVRVTEFENSTARPGSTFTRPTRPRTFLDADEFGESFSGTNRSGGTVNMTELVPKSPLAEESRRGDWEFEIEWIVELQPPLEARPKVDDTPSNTEDGPTAPQETPPADSTPTASAKPVGIDETTLAQAHLETEATR